MPQSHRAAMLVVYTDTFMHIRMDDLFRMMFTLLCGSCGVRYLLGYSPVMM